MLLDKHLLETENWKAVKAIPKYERLIGNFRIKKHFSVCWNLV